MTKAKPKLETTDDIPDFLKRVETPEQADKRRKKYAPKDKADGLKVKKLPEPVDPKIAKAIAKDLKEVSNLRKDDHETLTDFVVRGQKAIQIAKAKKAKAPKPAKGILAKALKDRDALNAKAAATKTKAKPDQKAKPKSDGSSKKETVIAMMNEGATMEALTKATGWSAHSMHGLISGTLRAKLKLKVVAEKSKDGVNVYRIR